MENILNSSLTELYIKRAKLESASRIFLGFQFILVAFIYFSMYYFKVNTSVSLFLPLILIFSISILIFLSNTVIKYKDFFESLIAPIINISLVLFLLNILTISNHALSVVKNENIYSLKNVEVATFIVLISYGFVLITTGIVRILNKKKDIYDILPDLKITSILASIGIPTIILFLATNSIPLVTLLIISCVLYLIYYNNNTWFNMYSIFDMKSLNKGKSSEMILITRIDKKSFETKGMKFEPQQTKGLIVGGLLGSLYLMTSIFDFYFGLSNMTKNLTNTLPPIPNIKK